VELRALDWHHQALLNTVERRAAAHDDLRMGILAKNIASLTSESIPTMFRTECARLVAITDLFKKQVDEGIASTKRLDPQMQSAFPRQTFLQIRFA
jgi:hypothetical protein